jgi:hypothetical protein
VVKGVGNELVALPSNVEREIESEFDPTIKIVAIECA